MAQIPVETRPMPAWVWAVFGGMATLTALAFGLAWLLKMPTPVPAKTTPPAPQASLFTPTYGPTEITPVDEASPTTITVLEPLPAAEPVSPVEAPLPPPPPLEGAPKWITNAAPAAISPGQPRLAIVIDDMGLVPHLSAEALEKLPSTITFAFLPYGQVSYAQATRAREKGHEIIIHLPMEPLPHANPATGQNYDAGPNALLTEDTPGQLQEKLAANLKHLAPLAVGVNNHMGSAFTRNQKGMEQVLGALQSEGLMFLDSKTSAGTATRAAAKATGVSIPVLGRDVFLDDTATPEAVLAQLKKAIALAQKKGSAIAIGHPLPHTLAVLEHYLPELTSGTVVLVPLTNLIPSP